MSDIRQITVEEAVQESVVRERLDRVYNLQKFLKQIPKRSSKYQEMKERYEQLWNEYLKEKNILEELKKR